MRKELDNFKQVFESLNGHMKITFFSVQIKKQGWSKVNHMANYKEE